MPILAKEISVYPSELLSSPRFSDQQSDEELKWYVVYTRARHEKSLARHLVAKEMPFYLPLIFKEQFIRGRRTQSYLPVFSGYMFYFGNAPDEVPKLAPYCVSCVLPVADQHRLQGELHAIHQLLDAGVELTVEAKLVEGQVVRVKTGVLRGMEGTIVRRKNGHRLLVAVNYLQQGVSVEIEDFMVEAI